MNQYSPYIPRESTLLPSFVLVDTIIKNHSEIMECIHNKFGSRFEYQRTITYSQSSRTKTWITHELSDRSITSWMNTAFDGQPCFELHINFGRYTCIVGIYRMRGNDIVMTYGAREYDLHYIDTVTKQGITEENIIKQTQLDKLIKKI